jgi:serine/threonine-protein kinase
VAEVNSTSPTAQSPAPLVAGKYRLTELLGRGGMGSVWAGIHTTLGTRVAVKFIDAEHVDSPEARQRFENEARAAASLRSKHVVEVYDHGVMEDGRPFIVMELLAGEPLDRRLDRVGRLPAKDTSRLVTMVCRALSKAHAAGIVHRDLKPENVFLVWDDEDGADVAKVVDFGIAKFTDQVMGPSSATRTGSVLGTPYYMSPEQARGLRSVDFRSDLWSVGVIAFRCVTGRLPFEGEAVGDVLVKLCTAPIPVPSAYAPDLPPAFDAWIQRALAREPEGRFQSAPELAGALAAVCGLSNSPLTSSGESVAVSGAHYGHVPTRVTPAPFMQTTPSNALTPHPAQTGAPITQTPPPARASKSKLPTLIAVALVAVAIVGIGIGVALKAFGPADADTGPAALQPTQPTATPEPPVVVAPVATSPAPTAVPSAIAPPVSSLASRGTVAEAPAKVAEAPAKVAEAPAKVAEAPAKVAEAPVNAPLARPAPARPPARPAGPVRPRPPGPTAAPAKPPTPTADIGF